MTTAAPVSGTASTLVLDPDRPEMSASDIASDNFAVLQMLRRSRARWSLVHAGGGVSRLVLALDGVPR